MNSSHYGSNESVNVRGCPADGHGHIRAPDGLEMTRSAYRQRCRYVAMRLFDLRFSSAAVEWVLSVILAFRRLLRCGKSARMMSAISLVRAVIRLHFDFKTRDRHALVGAPSFRQADANRLWFALRISRVRAGLLMA